jgi:cytochrome b pre-mRNA-processing protein 3
LSVGKRIKLLAENFYGRIRAYEEGLSDQREKLDAAISRNVLANAAEPAASTESVLPFARAVADYVRRETAALAVQPLRDLEAGRVVFGPAPLFKG